MKKEAKLLEEYDRSPTRSLFLGVKNKRLEQYKKESNEIEMCICGKPIGPDKYYGEVGHIGHGSNLVPIEVRIAGGIVVNSIEPKTTNKQGKKLPKGWWYDFLKLCPGCFQEVSTLLIRKAIKGQNLSKERTKHTIHQAEK